MENDFVTIALILSFAFNVILILGMIIQNFLNRGQIDIKQVNQLIGILEPRVAQTPTQLDDIGLSIGKQIAAMLDRPTAPGIPASGIGGDEVGEYNDNRGV